MSAIYSFFHCLEVEKTSINAALLFVKIAFRVGKIIIGEKHLCLLEFCCLPYLICVESCCVCYIFWHGVSSKPEEGSQVFGVAGWSLQGDQQIKVCTVRWLQAGVEDGQSTLSGRTQQENRAQKKLHILTYTQLVSAVGGLCIQDHWFDQTACCCVTMWAKNRTLQELTLYSL